MNPLRTVQQAKINFLFFQDIITSVMGILILVTLMLSLSIRSGEFGATRDTPFQTELTAIKDRLAQIESQNQTAQQAILESAALPDAAALAAQTDAMRRQMAQLEGEQRRSEESMNRVQRSAADNASVT